MTPRECADASQRGGGGGGASRFLERNTSCPAFRFMLQTAQRYANRVGRSSDSRKPAG